MPIDKQDIARTAAKILLETNAVLINVKDPFTYTSGRKGPIYADCRRLISFPEERSILMDFGASLLREYAGGIDYVAGGETAGIPYAAFIAERLNKPMLYVRKKPKGFGRMAQIEGFIEGSGKRAVIIEDVQNYGASVKVFVDALRAADTIVEHIFVIFQHGHESSKRNMDDMGVTLHALTSWPTIFEIAREQKMFDEQTLRSAEEYLKNPEEWSDAHGGQVKEGVSH